jgi:hypothetical protein
VRCRVAVAVCLVAVVAPVLAGCGSSSKKSSHASTGSAAGATSNTLSIKIAEAGKTASYTLPKTAKGGLVKVELTNTGKQPHGAQLVLVMSGHTIAQALQALGASQQTGKTPPWVRAAGGIGSAAPGQTASATVILAAGTYLVADLGGGGGAGPPANGSLSITPGATGSLPSTGATVVAEAPAKDKYKWKVSGLKAGTNEVTFQSKGKNALHSLDVVRLTHNVSLAQIEAALASKSGGPPSFIDPSSVQSTGALDGGKAAVNTLTLNKPGQYVLFCPLKDRDGGKEHFKEGLLTKINIR